MMTCQNEILFFLLNFRLPTTQQNQRHLYSCCRCSCYCCCCRGCVGSVGVDPGDINAVDVVIPLRIPLTSINRANKSTGRTEQTQLNVRRNAQHNTTDSPVLSSFVGLCCSSDDDQEPPSPCPIQSSSDGSTDRCYKHQRHSHHRIPTPRSIHRFCTGRVSMTDWNGTESSSS